MQPLKLLVVEDDIASLELMVEVFTSLKEGVSVMISKSRPIPVVPSKSVDEIFDTLSALPPLLHCRKCGSELLHFDTTFFSEGGKAWTLPLPVCPKCDSPKDTARHVSNAA